MAELSAKQIKNFESFLEQGITPSQLKQYYGGISVGGSPMSGGGSQLFDDYAKFFEANTDTGGGTDINPFLGDEANGGFDYSTPQVAGTAYGAGATDAVKADDYLIRSASDSINFDQAPPSHIPQSPNLAASTYKEPYDPNSATSVTGSNRMLDAYGRPIPTRQDMTQTDFTVGVAGEGPNGTLEYASVPSTSPDVSSSVGEPIVVGAQTDSGINFNQPSPIGFDAGSVQSPVAMQQGQIGPIAGPAQAAFNDGSILGAGNNVAPAGGINFGGAGGDTGGGFSLAGVGDWFKDPGNQQLVNAGLGLGQFGLQAYTGLKGLNMAEDFYKNSVDMQRENLRRSAIDYGNQQTAASVSRGEISGAEAAKRYKNI